MFAAYKRIFDRWAAIPRRGGRHRRHRRRCVARVPGDRRHRRGRHRLLPDQRLRRQHRAGRGLPLLAERAAPAEPWPRWPTPGKSTCASVAELLGVPLTHRQIAGAGHRRGWTGPAPSSRRGLAAAGAWRPRAQRGEGRQGRRPEERLRFATEQARSTHFGKPGYLGPIGLKLPVKIVADRTVARMADFICGANEEDFHIPWHQLGTRPAEPDLVADIPQRGGRRPVARRPGRWPSSAASRSVMCSTSAPYSSGDERHLPGRDRQAAVDGDGLLRHRRDAHPRRGHRAEPRCARHHLAGGHRTVQVVVCPIGYDRSAEGQGRGRDSCTTSWRRKAST